MSRSGGNPTARGSYSRSDEAPRCVNAGTLHTAGHQHIPLKSAEDWKQPSHLHSSGSIGAMHFSCRTTVQSMHPMRQCSFLSSQTPGSWHSSQVMPYERTSRVTLPFRACMGQAFITIPCRNACSVSSLIFAWTVVKSSEVRDSADSSSKAAAGEGLMESGERRGDESGVIAPTDSRRLRFREAGGLTAEMPFRQAPPALPGAKIRVFVLTTAASGAAATGAGAGAATGAATTDAAAGVAMAALSLGAVVASALSAPRTVCKLPLLLHCLHPC